MLNRLYTILLSLAIVFSLFSCEEEEQTVDVPRQLFRPATLTLGIDANIVTFSWVPIKGAKYSLDIAKDSLQFINDLQNFTLEEGTKSLVVGDLWSLSRYSVRIKCISLDPATKDSEYNMATFKTGQENIFYTPSSSEIGSDHVLIKWDVTKTVTHVVVSLGTQDTSVSLSAQDIAAGQKDISGLLPATSYVFKIYNGEMPRGTITVKTLAKP